MSPETEVTVISTRNKSQAKYLAISVKGEFLEYIFHKIGGKKKIDPVIHDNKYSYKTLDLLEFYMQEFIYTDYPSQIMLQSIETQIVIQLLRNMDLDPIGNKNNLSQEKSYVRTFCNSI
ncbi:MAG: hypothetical protein PHY91_05670 [Tissierellia bacterium]|nr:hypothetical protein [Tissierellia bacterium]MDD4726627.1 hypothetical protein [Tissierellia bacterium]